MTSGATRAPAGRLALAAAIMLACLALDQATKAVVRRELPHGGRVELLPFLDLHHVHNTGVAFSLLSGRAGLVLGISVVVVAMLLWFLWRMPLDNRMGSIGIAVVLGGAAGNVADRLRLGHVTDFIELPNWPTFNVADIFIVGGVGLVLVGQWRSERRRDQAERRVEQQEAHLDAP